MDPQKPTYVCRFHKAIYGLKQAPWAWFNRFSSFIIRYGFIQSKVDHSLFVYRRDAELMVLLLYVDDIILTRNDSSLLSSFTFLLSKEFEIKDLGNLPYFLGIEVISLWHGLRLSQTKYVMDLLKRSNMLECKPCSTPLAAKSQLSASDGDLLLDVTEYRHLVGSLQYLTLTRPDISYAVQHVAQFMSISRTSHMLAVKRILRCLKGSLEFGLNFRPAFTPYRLSAFSNADWVGCPDSR